jgi:hypothetical protein
LIYYTMPAWLIKPSSLQNPLGWANYFMLDLF